MKRFSSCLYKKFYYQTRGRGKYAPKDSKMFSSALYLGKRDEVDGQDERSDGDPLLDVLEDDAVAALEAGRPLLPVAGVHVEAEILHLSRIVKM
jgi:hypothetical protein